MTVVKGFTAPHADIFATQERIILNDLNKVKSRIGSLSKTKLALLSPAASKLLTDDVPKMISELQAAREVIQAVKLDVKQEKSFFVHERLFYYDKLMGIMK